MYRFCAEAMASTRVAPDRLVVIAPSRQEDRQLLRLQPVVLVLPAVGVRGELPQAANDLVKQGAEHAPP